MPHILVNGIVSHRDKKPYVQVDVDGRLVQLSIAEARKVAVDIFTSASYAEADAMLHDFFGKMEFPPEVLGRLMIDFREFRHDLAMQQVEGSFSDPDKET